jgi:hypothetical protein
VGSSSDGGISHMLLELDIRVDVKIFVAVVVHLPWSKLRARHHASVVELQVNVDVEARVIHRVTRMLFILVIAVVESMIAFATISISKI